MQPAWRSRTFRRDSPGASVCPPAGRSPTSPPSTRSPGFREEVMSRRCFYLKGVTCERCTDTPSRGKERGRRRWGVRNKGPEDKTSNASRETIHPKWLFYTRSEVNLFEIKKSRLVIFKTAAVLSFRLLWASSSRLSSPISRTFCLCSSHFLLHLWPPALHH